MLWFFFSLYCLWNSIDGAIIVVEYANRRANEGITKNKVFIISKKCLYRCCINIYHASRFFLNLLARNCRRIYVFSSSNTSCILSSSLFMALIFIPVLGKIFGTDQSDSTKNQTNLKLLETGNLK